MTITTNELV